MTTSLAATPHPQQRLDQLTRLVNQALAKSLVPPSGSPPRLHQAMRYCVLSAGKRFRPLLCLGGCEAVGGPVRRVLPVACAVEFIHTYSLVHDDLPAMDNAAERRGRPSCHRKFGEANAILVGDALLTRAFELLSADGIPNVLAIVRVLGQASGTAGLIGGQMLDLAFNVKRFTLNAKACEEIARRKTGALITASVVAGGLVSQASSSDVACLRRYGERLGLAFQFVDDLHDGDGLVRAIGAEAVRQRAASLIQQAKRALAPFGQRARLLNELADWLANSEASHATP
jgi:geranylgeranyl diphosphate synthase type II